jgi:hypothetical protein
MLPRVTYREDTAALRARIAELEGELSHLRSRIEKTEVLEAAVDAQEKRIGQLEAQRGIRLSRRLSWGAGLLASGLVVATFVLYFEVEEARHDASAARMGSSSALGQANMAAMNAQQALNAAQRLQSKPEPSFPPVVRKGTVAATTGEAPVSQDAACTVTVIGRSGGNGLNCRVEVRCADEIIYGKPGVGYLICNIDASGRPTFGRDGGFTSENKDPKIELDLANDRVVVSDDQPSLYTVEIALETAQSEK